MTRIEAAGDTTTGDRNARGAPGAGPAPARPRVPAWWIIARRELIELWLGGRLLALLVLFSVLMSVTAVLREIESAASLIPPVEMIFLTLLSTISFGMLIGVVAGADSISGERERATLEPLLLTPVGRRQIILGKFIAAISPWPVALGLSVPYAIVMSGGDEALVPGFAWTALLGSLLAIAFTGFGLLVSIWSSSNRTSLFVALLAYLLFLIPTQFPGEAQKGNLGYLVQQFNPMQASSGFIEKHIVNNRDPVELSAYLVSQPVAAIIVLLALFRYVAPRLRLEGETLRVRRPPRPLGRAVGPAGAALLLLAFAGVVLPFTTAAADFHGGGSHATARPGDTVTPAIAVTADLEYAVVNNGDSVEFATQVTNLGESDSPPLVIAMNVINLGLGGDPVDPEDWSPERTQAVGVLRPGDTAEQDWTVEAILDGDYMVYMTVVAAPDGAETTTQPVASPGVHITVRGVTRTNPGGVLPVAIGIPVMLGIATILLRRWWNRDRRPSTTPAG